MIADEDVRRALGESWGLPDDVQVERHDGGMGSRTWIVDGNGLRWVAKAVASHLAGSFAKGLQVARMVERAGVPAGEPVPAGSGEFTMDTADGWRMALLSWCPAFRLPVPTSGSSG